MDSLGPVLLYDGECGFCARSVRFVLDHNSAGNIKFAALQSEFGGRVCAEHGIDATELSSLVFIDKGKAYQRSAASSRVASHLDWPYRAGAAARIVPRFISDGVYNLIAKHRHRLMPTPEACQIPTPDESARFLS